MLALTVVLAGCQTIGPGAVQRDRLDYAGAIANSWKEQTLLNIVKLRYFDTPVFLDVASVISSYTLQGEINLAANTFPDAAVSTNRTLGATGTYIDRPTISYEPLTGEKFINSLLRPISPQAVFAMIQSGHQADYILQATVRAINGVYNHSASPARARTGDPAFDRLIEAVRRIQQAGALGMRVEKRDKEEVTLISFRRTGDKEVDKNIDVLFETLRIDPKKTEFPLAFGSVPRGGEEIVLLTRSILEILVELSAGIEVPPAHLTEGRAIPIPSPGPDATRLDYPLVRIHSSGEAPGDAFAAVRYRNYWFWIDDRDLGSKRVFTFLMMFSSLAETGAVPRVPVITIPAN